MQPNIISDNVNALEYLKITSLPLLGKAFTFTSFAIKSAYI